MGMVSGLIALVLLIGLASGPLLWRVRQDRREARALAIQADASHALFRVFGGESLVAVQVHAPSLGRPGRVVLSAPSDWQGLLVPASSGVVTHVPPDYELVVRPAAAAAPSLPSRELALHRAA
jgi:hypothetical protein